jgi:hypothetical protein
MHFLELIFCSLLECIEPLFTELICDANSKSKLHRGRTKRASESWVTR